MRRAVWLCIVERFERFGGGLTYLYACMRCMSDFLVVVVVVVVYLDIRCVHSVHIFI